MGGGGWPFDLFLLKSLKLGEEKNELHLGQTFAIANFLEVTFYRAIFPVKYCNWVVTVKGRSFATLSD